MVPAFFRCRSWAISTRFSRPVRISSTAANCPVRLIDSRTSAGLRDDVESVDARPRVGLEQRGQDVHDRGLARAVRAEQGEDAAPRHVEVHAAQNLQLPIRFLQALHVDCRPLERIGGNRRVRSLVRHCSLPAFMGRAGC